MVTFSTQTTSDSRVRRYIGYVSAFNAGRALLQSTVILYLIDVVRLPLAWTGALLAIDLTVTLLAELPTGAFADLRGRRRSFITACALSAVGTFTYGIPIFLSLAGPPTLIFLFAAVGEAILAIGFTFYSGALDAWAVDTTGEPRSSTHAKQILAQGQLAKSVAFLVAGALGILIYFWFGGSIVLNTFLIGGTILSVTFVHALAKMESGSEEISSRMSHAAPRADRQVLMSTVRASLSNTRLLQLLFASAASFTLLQLLIHFWPYYLTKEASTETRERAGMLALMLSWALAYGARSLGNYRAALSLRGNSYLLQVGTAALLSSLLVVALALGSNALASANAGPIAASVLYAAVRFLEGFAEPIRIGVLTDFCEARARATLYSIYSFACMLLAAITALAATALIALGMSITDVWMLAAALQAASAPVYLVLWKSGRLHARRYE